jgi:hypothetical protein
MKFDKIFQALNSNTLEWTAVLEWQSLKYKKFKKPAAFYHSTAGQLSLPYLCPLMEHLSSRTLQNMGTSQS